MDATWILRLDAVGDGPRIAVKDCMDVAGTPSTVGCRVIAADALPATLDAPVVETARRQGARIVGKANLVELCRHADGINPWTGTPVNPLDSARVPGGSSSGSAVAVAEDEADIGYGTDTGGSVRVPAACCGLVGLKTTAGRISTQGVFEFSRTLDTVGPLARDVAGAALGMAMLEPGFTIAEPPTGTPPPLARLRLPDVDPALDAAIDDALRTAGLQTTDVRLPQWRSWITAAKDLASAEGYWAHRHLLDRSEHLEDRHAGGIRQGRDFTAAQVLACRRSGRAASAHLNALLDRFSALALPTLAFEPPRIGEVRRGSMTYLTAPFNLAGLPALALPVPRGAGALPASLQLVGAAYTEESLLALGAHVEAALAANRR